MALLKEEDRKTLINEFKDLENPIDLVMFSQELECQYCKETRMIGEEVAELSDKINFKVYDFVKDKAVAEEYNVDKIPAIAVTKGGDNPKDYGIRHFGIPSGYEFSTLVEDIKMIGHGESGLSAKTKAEVANLKDPLHLQVFVTPTCPYCPPAVFLAHQLAFESDLIRGDMIEATEFPHLSMKYQVQGVPRTIINETTHQEGATPEAMLMAKIKQAVNN